MKAQILIGAMSVVAFALAGCIEDGTSDALDLGGAAVGQVDRTILTGSKCATAGGISVYPMDVLGGPVGPFQAKDMQPYIGNPKVGTYGMPIPGASTGIWHMTTACDAYTVDGVEQGAFSIGWVATMIEKPEFDTSDVDRHYIVADLSMTDLSLVEQIRAGTGVEISTLFSGTIDWTAPNVFTSVVDEENHGVFRTDAVVQEFDTLEPETVRFWMLVPVGGGHAEHEEMGPVPPIPTQEAGRSSLDEVKYKPIAFDMVIALDTGTKVAGPGHLSHTDNENHGNSVGANGNVQGLAEMGDFAMTFELGPEPEGIYLDSTWTH